jgi:hypothetical protein
MPKSTFFTGQPIFNQLLSLIPQTLVSQLVRENKSDRYCKKFKAYDHLVSMLFCSFHRCSSIRELITGLQANSHRLYHLGIRFTPRRSTLSDANKRRSCVFFEKLFHRLHQYHYGSLPDSLRKKKLAGKLFIVDSTTVTLFSEVFKGAGNYGLNGKKKGGVKAHMLVRAQDQLPCFVHISAAAKNDRTIMPLFKLPQGSVIVMDKAYNSYGSMIAWSREKITWVTRMKSDAVWQLLKERTLTQEHTSKGIRSDRVILLGNPKTKQLNALQEVRLVTFYDQATEREFLFICNNMQYSPLTIASIYKRRWEIELLFKRIKQNFQLHDFLGDNQNAVQIQLWCTLIADLLVKVVKDKVEKQRKRKWSFANMAGLIRLHLGTYIDLFKFLLNPEMAILGYVKEAQSYQLALFKT